MGWFKHWFGTRYYALLYGHRDVEDARLWVDAILERWGLPYGAEVLDLACGRGRHAFFFAKHGMKVSGIDISEASIAEARLAVPDGEFAVHDMRAPYAEGRFDAVACLFTSLGYFDKLEDDLAVLRSVFTALRPGGRFVIDFMNSELVLRELVPSEQITKDGVDFHIERTCIGGTLVKTIAVKDREVSHHFEERVQALLPHQLEEMAVAAGFLIDDRTDGPELREFDPNTSQRFVLWLRKPLP